MHATRSNLIVLLIETSDFSMNNSTNSTALHAPSFYQFDKQFLQELYDLPVERIKLLKASFLGFMYETLAKVADERESTRQLYLNNKQVFEFDPR